MATTVNRVMLPDGVRLECAERGDPDGLPIVFLHGYSDSWRSFEDVLPRLPAHLRAVAISQRGHGRSDRPHSGYRADQLARDVAACMTELGMERAVVVGHSMGASVAQRFALDFPERLLGLVLVGGRSEWPLAPGFAELCEYVRTSLADPVDPGFVMDFQRSTIAGPVAAGLLETMVAESLQVPAHVWRAACMDCLLHADTFDELARVRAPTSLVCGDADVLAIDAQPRLRQAMPHAELQVFAATGHALHWERPEEFVAAILAFVANLPRRARPARAAA